MRGSAGVSAKCGKSRAGEEGFLLLGALVAIFFVLLILSLAAPTMAKQLRREREVESAHRADQYVRAIRLFYRKNGSHYPGTIEQLEKTNNVRFLRQKYVDPLTGKADWRLIHFGEQKTTVKGFFGQPLAGLATTGVGGASSIGSPGANGSTPSVFGAPSTSGGAAPGTPGGGAPQSGSVFGGLSSPGSPSSGTGTGLGSTGSNGISSQSATSFSGSGAPFVGVGSSASGSAIVVVNEQTTYPTWEFIYDPRIEQLKAKSNLLGGGVASTSLSGLGSGSSLSSPTSSGITPSTPTSTPPSTGPGASPPR